MSCSHICTFLLIALSCYCLTQTKSLTMGQQQQTAKKVDLRNPLSGESYTTEQRDSHGTPATYVGQRQEKRPKRSQHDISEYKDLNDIIDEVEENTLMQAAAAAAYAGAPTQATMAVNTNNKAVQDFDFENMPPLTYYMLLQKLKQLQAGMPSYRVRTPRLGRSIDFQQLMDVSNAIGGGGNEDMTGTRQYVTRLIKKSVPFKPRLGKRTQLFCDRNN